MILESTEPEVKTQNFVPSAVNICPRKTLNCDVTPCFHGLKLDEFNQKGNSELPLCNANTPNLQKKFHEFSTSIY